MGVFDLTLHSRIKDLPEIRYVDVKDTDILLIENEEDTYRIPVSDLRVLLSCDSKIKAVYDELIAEITKVAEFSAEKAVEHDNKLLEHDNTIRAAVSTVQNMTARMTNYERIMTGAVEDMKQLNKKVDAYDESVKGVHSTLDDLNERLTDIETELPNVKQDITDIQNTSTDYSQAIADIRSQLATIDKAIEDLGGATIENVTEVREQLTTKMEEMFDALTKMVDERHHHIAIVAESN